MLLSNVIYVSNRTQSCIDLIETKKLVIKEVISNAEELTAKVVQNLTDLKYDKVEGKKVINTASKNILVEK